jgi:TctA family transporter
MGDGNLGILFTRPICLVVLGLAVLFVVGPTLVSRAARLRRPGAVPADRSTHADSNTTEETRV